MHVFLSPDPSNESSTKLVWRQFIWGLGMSRVVLIYSMHDSLPSMTTHASSSLIMICLQHATTNNPATIISRSSTKHRSSKWQTCWRRYVVRMTHWVQWLIFVKSVVPIMDIMHACQETILDLDSMSSLCISLKKLICLHIYTCRLTELVQVSVQC